jgi:hypothetical protein
MMWNVYYMEGMTSSALFGVELMLDGLGLSVSQGVEAREK